MATIKLQDGKVVLKNEKVSCICCNPLCVSGSASQEGTGGNPSGPCVDFITAKTTKAIIPGLYKCTGYVDDQGNMTWPGGSFFSPAQQPNIGPCYGGHEFEFYANLNIGDIVSCNAGSWGGGNGCNISCCVVLAP